MRRDDKYIQRGKPPCTAIHKTLELSYIQARARREHVRTTQRLENKVRPECSMVTRYTSGRSGTHRVPHAGGRSGTHRVPFDPSFILSPAKLKLSSA